MKMKKFVRRSVAVLLAVVMTISLMATASAATYTVKKGDSLWKIATETLGSGQKWKEIYEANRGKLKDPNLIFVGQELEIPVEGPAPATNFTSDIVWPDMFGDQKGILTVMPDTATWSITFENLYGSYHIAGTYAEDGTMTCTDDAGMGNFLPLDAICTAGEEVIKAFLTGKTDFAPGSSDKEDEGAATAGGFDAFTEGVLDHELTFAKLPDAYNTYDTKYKGTETYIEYTTDVYGDGVTYDKFARVYLSYGYDPNDKDTKYNVLYLQHGNSCSPSNWFDLKIPSADFTTLPDNIFDPEHGGMDSFIIVCLTYYLDIEKEDTTVHDGVIAGDGMYEGLPPCIIAR